MSERAGATIAGAAPARRRRTAMWIGCVDDAPSARRRRTTPSSKNAVLSAANGALVGVGAAGRVRWRRRPASRQRRPGSDRRRRRGRRVERATASARTRPFTNDQPRRPRRRRRNGVEPPRLGAGRAGAASGERGVGDRRDVREAPVLVARRREAERGEAVERRVARARQPVAGRARPRAKRVEAAAYASSCSATCAIALTPALPRGRLRASRSPSPRARAPAPCRPTARCGRRSARARSRARCS